jgi:2-dehydropantoate 2-reductase
MRICVLGGGGAMGGLFGGYLASAGQEVVLLDVSKESVERINSNGLKIEEKDGQVKSIAVRATTDPASVGAVDLIINFVKCYHTETAIDAIIPILTPKTTVLTLQNGWGNADVIAGKIGPERVIVGVTYHSAGLRGPGEVRHPASGMTFVGEPAGGESARVAAVANAFRGAGLEVTASDHIVEDVWKKLAHNVCTLPISALLGYFANELTEHDGTLALMRGLLAEVANVAVAKGIKFDREERWETITGALSRSRGSKASMLQDAEAKRRTEIDVINGAIVAGGRATGIPTPFNEAMVWLVSSMQESYSTTGKA